MDEWMGEESRFGGKKFLSGEARQRLGVARRRNRRGFRGRRKIDASWFRFTKGSLDYWYRGWSIDC